MPPFIRVPQRSSNPLMTQVAENGGLPRLGIEVHGLVHGAVGSVVAAVSAPSPPETACTMAVRLGEDEHDEEEAKAKLDHQQYLGRTRSGV